jgi:hypothetical protein
MEIHQTLELDGAVNFVSKRAAQVWMVLIVLVSVLATLTNKSARAMTVGAEKAANCSSVQEAMAIAMVGVLAPKIQTVGCLFVQSARQAGWVQHARSHVQTASSSQ